MNKMFLNFCNLLELGLSYKKIFETLNLPSNLVRVILENRSEAENIIYKNSLVKRSQYFKTKNIESKKLKDIEIFNDNELFTKLCSLIASGYKLKNMVGLLKITSYRLNKILVNNSNDGGLKYKKEYYDAVLVRKEQKKKQRLLDLKMKYHSQKKMFLKN